MHRTVFGREVYIPFDRFKPSRVIEVDIIKNYLRVEPDDVLLDIGSGTGYWTERISGRAFGVGLDIMWRDTAIAVKEHTRKRTAFILGSAEELPFEDGAFNKLFGVCSVEHIPDNLAAFREFSRCLQSGGVMALTLDALNYSGISEELRLSHSERNSVAHFYTVKSITQYLRDVGMTVTDTQYLICSPLSHFIHHHINHYNKLQYLFSPISYWLMILSDRFLGRKDQGWKLAVRAVKD